MAINTKKQKRDDVPVKLNVEVARMGKIVAAYEGTTMVELFSEILRPALQRLLEQHVADRAGGPKHR